VKPITMYQADDGTIWSSAHEAIERDAEIVAMRDLAAPLGPEVERGWRQQNPAAVRVLKAQLFKLFVERHPHWADEHKTLTAEQVLHGGGYASRILSESSERSPFCKLWFRAVEDLEAAEKAAREKS